MARTHPLDPLRPSFAAGRLASGLFAGMVGGLLFGVMLLTSATIADPEIHARSIGGALSQLLYSTNIVLVWSVHMVVAALAGLLFSVLFVPNSYRSNILWGLGYAVALWAVGYLLALRALTGMGIAFDAAAVYTLVGHLLYGLGLGASYVAIHDLMMRDAASADSPRWRAWARRERAQTRR